MADKNEAFGYGLGLRFGQFYPDLNINLQEKILEKSKQDGQFAYGVGQGLKTSNSSSNNELRKKFMNLSKKGSKLRKGLTTKTSAFFTYSKS